MKRLHTIRQIIGTSLTRKALLATICLATILLTLGYGFGELWLEVPVVFLVGILWGVCVLREIRWVDSLLFVVMMGAAALGYLVDLSHLLMLGAGCAAVLAWDFHYFEGRLLDLEEPATIEMEKNHLQRSLMVLGTSFLVIAVNSWLQIRIRFIVLVLLTVIAILLLNQVILIIRRTGRLVPPKE